MFIDKKTTPIEFDRSKVTFQPCPREFPELWRQEDLTLRQVTVQDIDGVRRLYFAQDMPEAIAHNNILLRLHGFLVHDTVLLGPRGGCESMVDLTAIIERFDLPQECLERAREFGLNESARCCISYGEHLGHRLKMKECTAVAREIWAPPAYHGEIIATPWPELELWFRKHILEQEAHTK